MHYMIIGAPMLFFWSLISFATPFGWLRVLPLLAAVVGVVYWQRRESRLAAGLGAWAALTYLLDLLAWWMSRGPMEPGHTKLTWVGLQSAGLVGFPWHALELPPGAMGGDRPTAEQWWVVMANLGCWGIVAAIIVAALLWRHGRSKPTSRVIPWLLLGTAFVLNQFLIVTFMLWFD